MPWTCRFVTEEERPKRRFRGGDVGLMWFAPGMVEGEHTEYYRQHVLSPEYLRDHLGKRPPLIVVLPGGHWWNVDTRASGSDHGWTVTGEPPHITVSPSIDVEGVYHGFLQNGVLTDDLGGRTYSSAELPGEEGGGA